VIGNSWVFEGKKNLDILFESDQEKWSIPEDMISSSDMEIYMHCLRDNLQYIFALYRKLAIESNNYPNIGYNDIKKFCYDINVITSWATPTITLGEDEEDGEDYSAMKMESNDVSSEMSGFADDNF